MGKKVKENTKKAMKMVNEINGLLEQKRKTPSYNKLINGKLPEIYIYTDFGPGFRRLVNFTVALKQFIELHDMENDKIKMIHINTVIKNILQRQGYDIHDDENERIHAARYIFNDIGCKIVALSRDYDDGIGECWGRLNDSEYIGDGGMTLRWCVSFGVPTSTNLVIDE